MRRRVLVAAFTVAWLPFGCSVILGIEDVPRPSDAAADGGDAADGGSGDGTSDADGGATSPCRGTSGALSLDPDFADGGIGIYPLHPDGGHDSVYTMILPNGRDILVSSDESGPTDAGVRVVARGFLKLLAARGTPDPSFGDGGRVLLPTDLPAPLGLTTDPSAENYYFGSGFKVARLTSGGAVDPSFTGISGVNGNSGDVGVDFLNRVLQAGAVAEPTNGFRVVRYTGVNGALDTTYGDGGSAFIAAAGPFGVGALPTLRLNGPDVIVGTRDSHDGPAILFRLNGSGILDPGFGEGGILRISDAVEIDSIVLDSHTKDRAGNATYVVTGYSGVATNTWYTARISYDGKKVEPFDMSQLPARITNTYGQTVAIDDQGRIVNAGSGVYGNDLYEWILARFEANGRLDRFVETHLHGNESPHALAIDTSGKIVVFGNASGGGQPDEIAVARYCP